MRDRACSHLHHRRARLPFTGVTTSSAELHPRCRVSRTPTAPCAAPSCSPTGMPTEVAEEVDAVPPSRRCLNSTKPSKLWPRQCCTLSFASRATWIPIANSARSAAACASRQGVPPCFRCHRRLLLCKLGSSSTGGSCRRPVIGVRSLCWDHDLPVNAGPGTTLSINWPSCYQAGL